MEQAIVSGIAHKSDEAKITIAGIRTSRASPPRSSPALADAKVNVDTIIQNQDQDVTDLSFTVPLRRSSPRARLAGGARRRARLPRVTSDDQIGKVTLVGAGMKSEPGVAAKMFRVLADAGDQHPDDRHLHDPHHGVIDRRELERAVRALHDAFDLGSEAARPRRCLTSPWSAPPAPSAPRCCACSRSGASPSPSCARWPPPQRGPGARLPRASASPSGAYAPTLRGHPDRALLGGRRALQAFAPPRSRPARS